MEEAKGVVKHVALTKFKDDITPERIEELTKAYANLLNVIPSMKSFHWYLPLPLSMSLLIAFRSDPLVYVWFNARANADVISS